MRSRRALAYAAAGVVALAACATVPYTKRSQLVLLSESQEIALGQSAFREVLAESTVLAEPRAVDGVRRVGERIAAVADRQDYKWEFVVINDDSMINAFALPGGKVAVYTGMFPVAEDEAGLAAVIGHEVAHALARHSGERMSQGVLLQVGAAGLSAGLGSADPVTRDLVMQAFGLGAQVGVMLPFSRGQESEADRIGLILMAKAGYDPEAALGLWQRMEKLSEKQPPEFLSTHPAYGTRQAQIRSWLPEARQYYKPVPGLAVAKLPAFAEFESAGDGGEAAFKRYARSIESKARSRGGAVIIAEAIGVTFDLSLDGVERRLDTFNLNLGEVAVISAIAKASRASFDALGRRYRGGEAFAALAGRDREVVQGAVALLREVAIAARQIERKHRRR